jgi:hypothetical protein
VLATNVVDVVTSIGGLIFDRAMSISSGCWST